MFGTFDFLWSSVSVLLFYTLLQLVLMLRDETICLMLFSCIRIRPHVMLFWCVRMRPHVSGGSDMSGWDHMSHVLMHQDETTCLMLLWCIRMRPHVSCCSDASGWDYMSHVVLMRQDETTRLGWFWCIGMRPRLGWFWCTGMRPYVSGGSDASGWGHMSHVVLMRQDETTSHESASATVLLLCTSLSAQSVMMWAWLLLYCVQWDTPAMI